MALATMQDLFVSNGSGSEDEAETDQGTKRGRPASRRG